MRTCMQKCAGDDGEPDLKKATLLLEVYSVELQMCAAQRNFKRLKVRLAARATAAAVVSADRRGPVPPVRLCERALRSTGAAAAAASLHRSKDRASACHWWSAILVGC